MMIWVVMLGMMLTSVFFFTATRLSGNLLSQQDFSRQASQKRTLESYAGYLKSLDPMARESLTNADFDDITGTVTQSTPAIEGFVDAGDTVSIPDVPAGDLNLQWNACEFGESGDLVINNDTENIYYPIGACGEGYADLTPFTLPAESVLTLTAITGPLHFRLTSTSGTMFTDTRWHLDLSIPTQFGKDIEWKEDFE